MSKFDVNDIVVVVVGGHGCCSSCKGQEVKIVEVGEYSGGPGYRVLPSIGNSKSGNYGGMIGEESFSFVRKSYPNPPHKHADIIKAWADGAEVERQFSTGAWVRVIDAPQWYPHTAYRVKPLPPVKSAIEIERDSISAEMAVLKQRLDKLKVV